MHICALLSYSGLILVFDWGLVSISMTHSFIDAGLHSRGLDALHCQHAGDKHN